VYAYAQEPFNRIKKELLKECKSLGPGDRVLILGNSREPCLATKKDEKAFMGFWSKHIFLPAPDYASRRVSVGAQGHMFSWTRRIVWLCNARTATDLHNGEAGRAGDRATALTPHAHGALKTGTQCCAPYLPLLTPQLLWPSLVERHGGRLLIDFDLSTLALISESYTSGAIDMVVHSMLTKRRLERLKTVHIDIPEIMQWLCKVEPLSREQDELLRKWSDKTPVSEWSDVPRMSQL
jgi:hypothetical protein